jgi:hypothetical protein
MYTRASKLGLFVRVYACVQGSRVPGAAGSAKQADHLAE